MSQPTRTLKAIPQTTLRRLRNTPTYFSLIWRWSTWVYALIWIASFNPQPNVRLSTILLTVTFVQSLVVTLYAPVFQIFLPSFFGLRRNPLQRQQKRLRARLRKRQRQTTQITEEEIDTLTPLSRARNPYWDMAIYGLDLLISGLAIYLSGPWGNPSFGDSSPFYRYGISTILVAAFTYRYRGGLLAALGYSLFILLGAFLPPPGTPHFVPQIQDLEGSLIDAPLIAIIAAYLTTLLNSYTRSKKREQDNVRRQQALLNVGETLVRDASNKQRLLQQSAEQIRRGGHFERLIIAIGSTAATGENNHQSPVQIETLIDVGPVEAISPQESQVLLERVIASGEKLSSFDMPKDTVDQNGYGLARLYLPIFKEGEPLLVLGAESIRQTPFEEKQEVFLTIVGAQLQTVLENIRLTEQAAELAAQAERGRIAREIHDGVAQLIYMLSLQTETCAALAQRIAESTEVEEEMAPLMERLDRLTTISKQALWETRHYMFTLKPLILGTTTLTQMLTNQLQEFETISGLPVKLAVEGIEEKINGDKDHSRKIAQVGTAIFRITQEALTNAYKHANASAVEVHLHYLPGAIEITISDNGKGMQQAPQNGVLSNLVEKQRIYSGHGMQGMRERAEELGGTFEVNGSATGGVSASAHIPI